MSILIKNKSFNYSQFIVNLLKGMQIKKVIYKDQVFNLANNESDFASAVIGHAQAIFTHLTGLSEDESWAKLPEPFKESEQSPETSLGLFLITESLQYAKTQQLSSDTATLNINCLSVIRDRYLLDRFLDTIAPRAKEDNLTDKTADSLRS